MTSSNETEEERHQRIERAAAVKAVQKKEMAELEQRKLAEQVARDAERREQARTLLQMFGDTLTNEREALKALEYKNYNGDSVTEWLLEDSQRTRDVVRRLIEKEDREESLRIALLQASNALPAQAASAAQSPSRTLKADTKAANVKVVKNLYSSSTSSNFVHTQSYAKPVITPESPVRLNAQEKVWLTEIEKKLVRSGAMSPSEIRSIMNELRRGGNERANAILLLRNEVPDLPHLPPAALSDASAVVPLSPKAARSGIRVRLARELVIADPPNSSTAPSCLASLLSPLARAIWVPEMDACVDKIGVINQLHHAESCFASVLFDDPELSCLQCWNIPVDLLCSVEEASVDNDDQTLVPTFAHSLFSLRRGQLGAQVAARFAGQALSLLISLAGSSVTSPIVSTLDMLRLSVGDSPLSLRSVPPVSTACLLESAFASPDISSALCEQVTSNLALSIEFDLSDGQCCSYSCDGSMRGLVLSFLQDTKMIHSDSMLNFYRDEKCTSLVRSIHGGEGNAAPSLAPLLLPAEDLYLQLVSTHGEHIKISLSPLHPDLILILWGIDRMVGLCQDEDLPKLKNECLHNRLVVLVVWLFDFILFSASVPSSVRERIFCSISRALRIAGIGPRVFTPKMHPMIRLLLDEVQLLGRGYQGLHQHLSSCSSSFVSLPTYLQSLCELLAAIHKSLGAHHFETISDGVNSPDLPVLQFYPMTQPTTQSGPSTSMCSLSGPAHSLSSSASEGMILTPHESKDHQDVALASATRITEMGCSPSQASASLDATEGRVEIAVDAPMDGIVFETSPIFEPGHPRRVLIDPNDDKKSDSPATDCDSEDVNNNFSDDYDEAGDANGSDEDDLSAALLLSLQSKDIKKSPSSEVSSDAHEPSNQPTSINPSSIFGSAPCSLVGDNVKHETASWLSAYWTVDELVDVFLDHSQPKGLTEACSRFFHELDAEGSYMYESPNSNFDAGHVLSCPKAQEFLRSGRHPQLSSLEPEQLIKHVETQIKFIRALRIALPLINTSYLSEKDSLGARLSSVRWALPPSLSRSFLDAVLEHCSVRQLPTKPRANIDRLAAAAAKDSQLLAGPSIFMQAFSQLGSLPASAFMIARPGGSSPHTAFDVTFRNEHAVGEGGPYRQLFADLCGDLQSSESGGSCVNSVLPLLIPSANQRSQVGDHRDMFVLRPLVPGQEPYFEFFGRILALALRTGVLLPLALPALFWKLLLDAPVTRADLAEIDATFVSSLDAVERGSRQDFESQFGQTLVFATTRSDATVVELKAQGAHQTVSFDDRFTYVSLALDARLTESRAAIQALQRGLHALVPREALALLTWQTLQKLLCGSLEVDLALLKRHTELAPGIPQDSEFIKWFWEVLEELSHADRRRFIQFAWAQERLPATDADFTRNGKTTRMLIKSAAIAPGQSSDERFPRADTCFFNLELPKYSSKEVMRLRINAVLQLSGSAMDGDEAPQPVRDRQRERALFSLRASDFPDMIPSGEGDRVNSGEGDESPTIDVDDDSFSDHDDNLDVSD